MKILIFLLFLVAFFGFSAKADQCLKDLHDQCIDDINKVHLRH